MVGKAKGILASCVAAGMVFSAGAVQAAELKIALVETLSGPQASKCRQVFLMHHPTEKALPVIGLQTVDAQTALAHPVPDRQQQSGYQIEGRCPELG